MIDLNIRALTALTLRFLPSVTASKGGVLNVASVASFMPGPGFAVYYATKAFVRSFSEAVLEKAHRKLLKRGKGFAVLDAHDRHKLRIRIKKVRYAAEFFSPLYPAERSEPFLNALRAMQDDLGKLNDVETARGLVDGQIGRAHI